MHNRETSVKLALEAIENGISESKAAIDYNIPRSTLYNRHAGRIDAHSSHTNQQRFRAGGEAQADARPARHGHHGLRRLQRVVVVTAAGVCTQVWTHRRQGRHETLRVVDCVQRLVAMLRWGWTGLAWPDRVARLGTAEHG